MVGEEHRLDRCAPADVLGCVAAAWSGVAGIRPPQPPCRQQPSTGQCNVHGSLSTGTLGATGLPRTCNRARLRQVHVTCGWDPLSVARGRLVLSPGAPSVCTFVLGNLLPNSAVGSLERGFFRFQQVVPGSMASVLQASELFGRLTRRHCDCGTALAVSCTTERAAERKSETGPVGATPPRSSPHLHA